MTRDDPLLDALADANPQPTETTPLPSRIELERTLAAITRTPVGRRSRSRRLRPAVRAGTLLPALTVLIVAAVVAVALTGMHGPGRAGSGPHPTVTTQTRLVLTLTPTPAHPRVTGGLVDEEITILESRLRRDGVDAHVSLLGARTVAIAARGVSPARLRAAVQSPVLAFTDWEANVIAPDGRPVAVQERGDHPAARLLSQGTERSAPGSADTGATTLYAAVRLASRQPARPVTSSLTRLGAEYFAFAAAHSVRCPGSTPCYLAGPAASRRALGVAHATVLRVAQGTIVAQASGEAAGDGDPAARFYVLRDDAALTGSAVAGARVRTAPTGAPAVLIRLTAAGQRAFQALTAGVARRASDLGESNGTHQHIATLVDDRLVTVAYIDQNTDPDGVISGPVELVGGIGSESRLAASLRLDALPLGLRPVSR